jgi:hypothetical protein
MCSKQRGKDIWAAYMKTFMLQKSQQTKGKANIFKTES